MPRVRELVVPAAAHATRLDRFLARWFSTWSRSALRRGVDAGEVCDGEGRPLKASALLREGMVLRIAIPGIAPTSEPPPLPPVLYEDDRVLVLDKPAGLLAHPAGADFAWAAVGLAKEARPGDLIDLVHRLDRDTSGVLVLSKDHAAAASLKGAFKAGRVIKRYEAIVKGEVPWGSRQLTGAIGPADGVIRIQMAVRPDGLTARTDVEVVDRQPGLTRVRCRLYTGRTHQIRVHLAHEGFPLLGDRMYGVPPEVFLRAWEEGVDDWVIAQAGAPRQALHAASVELPHPDGHILTVCAPFPEDLTGWWADPSVLPGG
ncbi:MAG: RluA family pseudouridine synthase [Deltaproteobacteria bacterium]|nr:RluA family pseudouridine synthase [Deltaproteobacteria bacterium]